MGICLSGAIKLGDHLTIHARHRLETFESRCFTLHIAALQMHFQPKLFDPSRLWHESEHSAPNFSCIEAKLISRV